MTNKILSSIKRPYDIPLAALSSLEISYAAGYALSSHAYEADYSDAWFISNTVH